MKLQVVGCSHHTAPVAIRERLAFTPDQARDALEGFRERFPESEAVLLSTCNRVELYAASENAASCPSAQQVAEFLARFHGLTAEEVLSELYERSGADAIRHLFMVAASLDSMVVGEAQILSQVKEAYALARHGNSAGPLIHQAFEAANRVAKRVATETTIQQRRVSIPSVAVGDYARQFFEQFDDKQVLVIGAGDMGAETLRYLVDEGARRIAIVNRSHPRAVKLADTFGGIVHDWEQLPDLLVEADVVVSTTGASSPVVTLDDFRLIERKRAQKPVFILDLAVPRDFEPEIGRLNNVYLYSVDDLRSVCERNRELRKREWPAAERIVDEETARFMAEMHHRVTVPTIRRLTELAESVKSEELDRLWRKLDEADERTKDEVQRAFDRLVNKLLHPPLKSLRHEASQGTPHGLLEALRRLFHLKD